MPINPKINCYSERFLATIGHIPDEHCLDTMKTFSLPALFSIIMISAGLSACGGAAPKNVVPVIQTAAATHVVDLSVDPAATGQTPLPDCADQNCSGLRIIDGNAEAFRIDAMRRQGS
jgi:hypothetical protein